MIQNNKPALFKFAFFPDFEKSIEFLSDSLADKEEWDFSDSSKKTYQILKNYIHYTFVKLQQDKQIEFTSDNKYASFNTGLITGNYEEIFAFFEKYNNPKPGFESSYFFKSFLKKSDGQFLNYFSKNIPKRANFFSNPELLIFNPLYDIIPDIDHIIGDNISRFPSFLQTSDQSSIRRQLIGSIDEAKIKVQTNYKLAVPQHYNGKIQLLIPLCLTSGSPNPDLALVIYKMDSSYCARTCLTLKMAYNNARLIVKPQSNWLKV